MIGMHWDCQCNRKGKAMEIEHVYRCMRCGNVIKIPAYERVHILSDTKQDILTNNNPSNHYCNQEEGIVGRLELIGMNVKN